MRGVLTEQAELPGARHRLGAVDGAELAEYVADVFLGRLRGHHQLPGDLLVRQARRQQPEHLELPVGQRAGQTCHRRRGRPGSAGTN